jgi:hypothetical protein
MKDKQQQQTILAKAQASMGIQPDFIKYMTNMDAQDKANQITGTKDVDGAIEILNSLSKTYGPDKMSSVLQQISHTSGGNGISDALLLVPQFVATKNKSTADDIVEAIKYQHLNTLNKPLIGSKLSTLQSTVYAGLSPLLGSSMQRVDATTANRFKNAANLLTTLYKSQGFSDKDTATKVTKALYHDVYTPVTVGSLGSKQQLLVAKQDTQGNPTNFDIHKIQWAATDYLNKGFKLDQLYHEKTKATTNNITKEAVAIYTAERVKAGLSQINDNLVLLPSANGTKAYVYYHDVNLNKNLLLVNPNKQPISLDYKTLQDYYDKNTGSKKTDWAESINDSHEIWNTTRLLK